MSSKNKIEQFWVDGSIEHVKPVLSESDSLETGLTGATFARGIPNF